MRMLRHIKNNKGIALMMVLMIATISLAVMSTLLYLITIGTKISGMQKRYATALDAGKGSEAIVTSFIGKRGVMATGFANNISYDSVLTSTCQSDKLNKATADWDASCDSSLTMDPSDPATYDMTFDLGNYRVYSKIVETIEGNTGAAASGSELIKGGVVGGNAGEISVLAISYVYAIEVDARNTLNTDEHARLSILYRY